MRKIFRGGLAGLILVGAGAACATAQAAPGIRPIDGRDTVHVAPPTGERAADRASILAALEQVRPGGTVQFAPGTYLVGEIVPIPTPRVTLLGHPDGTTLRGCDPAAYEEMERDAAAAGEDWRARFDAVRRCGMFELMGGHATVRSFTFEYTRMGLILGCCHIEREDRLTEGGYLIEGNTFRNSGNGIRPGLLTAEPTVIRDNRFINTFHAISAIGGHLHVLENDISVPKPEQVPGVGHPSFAILFCGDYNIVAGNRIEGHPDGIELYAWGDGCRHNVIRDNTIEVRRVPLPRTRPYPDLARVTDVADSTIVGVPLLLSNERGEAPLEDNLIEGNRFLGAEGIAIELSGGARNRIVNNTFSGIRVRDQFPGNVLGALPVWEIANGSAIWVSPGSEENEIRGNTFEDIASYAVVVEGDRNRVETRGAGDAVRDLGSRNRVSGPAGAREPTADPPRSGILEAGRLVFHQLLHPVGEETYTLAREGDAYVLHADFNHNDRGQRTERSVALHLGLDLAPRASQLREIVDGDTTETAVEVNGRLATVTDASGSRRVAVPDRFFTTTVSAPHAVQALLVRYWLRNGRPASIPVLPRGNAVVRHVGLDTLEVAGETVALDRYHVDGVRWGGQTLWLDGEERLVAAVSFDFNYQAVREGYEGALAFFSERARRDVLTRAEAASRRIAPLHTGTFALVGGALIDGTGAPPLADATVVVRDGRITAVGPRASVTIPADAEVVDVTGTTLLPGLWDMHAHLAGITDFGPIYLAAGVTTVRDVGNETDWGLALREAFATGRIAGPRLLLAAEIDGRVPEAVGAIQADTPEEARALVRHFHDLGFEQIKLYNRFRPELVPVIAEEAHRLGMTVTGHVPWGMSTIEALQAGMDQINHVSSVAAIGNMIPATIRESRDVAGALTWLADLDLGLETRSLIDTLVRHGTVVDPTLAAFELRSRPANVPFHEIEPGAARMPPVVANTIERWFPGRPADVAELYDALQRKHVELVGILHRAGVPIVAGTDVVIPGHSLHRELELYVEAGMTPVEAIQAATIVPARAMGLDHDVGTVEVGKRADLIVVDGDPLRSIREIRNVRAVVANGRIFDTDALWRSVGFESEALESRFGPTGFDAWPVDVPPDDTIRYSAIVNGMPAGERLMWNEGPEKWAYSYDIGESDFPRTELLVLADDGLPLRVDISGQKPPWDSWEERFESGDGTVRWTTPVDEGERPADAPAYYAPLHPAHDPGVLTRALLHRSSGRLPLLPDGEARLEKLGERTVDVDGRTRTLHHYAVHGLDLKPAYVWLDSNGATFADEWTVRSGWESVFPELKSHTLAALAEHVRGLARIMAPPQGDRALVIRGARLFDAASSSVRPATTILIEGNRIAAVGADGSFEIPADVSVIDADGRTVLPGLWDMHAHHGTSLLEFFRYRELDAPLHLAGGVTSARDLGSHTDELLSLRRRIETGEAVGPRLLAAGFVDGVGGSRAGVQVGSADEARAAVDRFVELGYVQIKIYGQLPAELVPVVIERAERHGLRVSGHIPGSMSAQEAVEVGFDELQHVEIAMSGILGSHDDLIVRWADDLEGLADAQAALQPGSAAVREFIDLLVANDVAVDPTLALWLSSEVPPHYIAPVLERFPPQARRRLLDRFWSRPPQVVERWDRYVSSWMGFVRAAHEASVPVLPGTDLMPGFGLHRELELYVQAGIPAPEVLTLATLGAARAMGMDGELGSIEPGKLADLILVDGDPVTDISDIRRVVTVIKDGRVYDPAEIYRALGIEPCCEQ